MGHSYSQGCRCEDCRGYNRRNVEDWRAKVKGKEPPKHGRSGYTNYACRCEVCRKANHP
ncbi:MAG: hypothetical protein ACREJP_10245 [Candidatus Methylomirabilales bacterium]